MRFTIPETTHDLPAHPVTHMRGTPVMTALITRLHVQLLELRTRARADGERGEVVEKTALEVGMAALALTVLGAIGVAVAAKLASLVL